ncbi:MAG: OadG family protein [Bacteroidales bacterium]|jgi:Na+-transporting methylmalonyl-CoA/oxaloacetate decarboxylase gamma subunit|nr:OadG family protein [Bacteroidales bacterium]MBQ2104635.1 OadG family protein [Bacteroidales bacterium]MBQ2501288.1 OadG family protein [Bacteroidales bacterium]MBQ3977180.1 OadG family protein [Bacteroidales bacterium]MBQ4168668.1 OadG family protein [Bacteroidales bacterium]
MMNLLFTELPNGHTITDKGAALLQTDPHGTTLTLIAVSTVFLGLIILYCIYTLSGNIFSGKYKKDPSKKKAKVKAPAKAAGMTPEVAAAIALALNAGAGNEAEIAALTALSLYLGTSTHDAESYILTIKDSGNSWNNNQNFRKLPR